MRQPKQQVTAEEMQAAGLQRLAEIKATTPTLAITTTQHDRLRRMLTKTAYRVVINLASNPGIQTSELGRISSAGNTSHFLAESREALERVGLMAECELLTLKNAHGQFTTRGFWTLNVVDPVKWRKADQEDRAAA